MPAGIIAAVAKLGGAGRRHIAQDRVQGDGVRGVLVTFITGCPA